MWQRKKCLETLQMINQEISSVNKGRRSFEAGTIDWGIINIDSKHNWYERIEIKENVFFFCSDCSWTQCLCVCFGFFDEVFFLCIVDMDQQIFQFAPWQRFTYVHSYSFQRSMHSNGSGQMTFAHGLFDGQLRSKFLAIVACPHWVPFIAGGRGKCFPSNLFDGCAKARKWIKWKCFDEGRWER